MRIFYFSYVEEKNQWIAENPEYPVFQAILNKGYVLGTQEWKVYNDSKLCNNLPTYATTMSLSSCSMDQFTCHDGNCVDIGMRWVEQYLTNGQHRPKYLKFWNWRCDAELNCKDGSDEQECRLVVPNVGYNKNLIPLPMKGDQHFYVNVSYNIKHILYIDENENIIRITYL